MTRERLFTELERQHWYLAQLPEDYSFPLFNAKEALESQRSSGYRNTAAAVRELVDNAIEAGATRVHVLFRLSDARAVGKGRTVDALAVVDNGSGMLPEMARYALSWGGGTHFREPAFIGKFGFGLPNASINQTRRTIVFTRTGRQQPLSQVRLDFEDFASYGVQRIPPPLEVKALPDFVARHLQTEGWDFDHGTAVVWERPDRLTYRTPANLKDLLLDDFGVSYRYLLLDPARALEIKIEGITVQAVDPLFLEPGGRLYVPPDRGGAREEVDVSIPVLLFKDSSTGEVELTSASSTHPEREAAREQGQTVRSTLRVRVGRFPKGLVEGAPGAKGTDAYRRFQIRKARRGMSFVRAGREIETVDAFPRSERDKNSGLGDWPLLQSYAYHWGIEVHFPPELDDAFGITNDKQGVRPIAGFWRVLAAEGVDGVLRRENAFQEKERRKTPEPAGASAPSAAEQAASDADVAMRGATPPPPPSRRAEADTNLDEDARRLADQTSIPFDEAKERITAGTALWPYKVDFVYEPGAPPWRPRWKGLQVVTEINRAHSFYSELYGQLLGLPDGERLRHALDVLLIALSRGEAKAEGALQLFYETQREQHWGPDLATILKHLCLSLDREQGLDEPEEHNAESEDEQGWPLSAGEKVRVTQTAVELDRALKAMGFQVEGWVAAEDADVGPSVVRFKVRLKPTERLSALQGRASDIMREVQAAREPIIDNLAGTPYVYVDLPRPVRQDVPLTAYLTRTAKRSRSGQLGVPLGVMPSGDALEVDLTTLPHMLVAGTTGSGKTMFLYSLIASLARRYTPEDVQLVLIDPKETDFVFFDGLKHLRMPVITDAGEAVEALQHLLGDEVERRTRLLTQHRARDLTSLLAQKMPAPPRVVVVIDEFADLADIMTPVEQESFDTSIKRLAQRARNVGIHLVVATQRPSADIVKGAIKTNLPCRVSFQLASQVDSRVILDQPGAERLMGRGDMLVSLGGVTMRLQGFFASDHDLASLLPAQRSLV